MSRIPDLADILTSQPGPRPAPEGTLMTTRLAVDLTPQETAELADMLATLRAAGYQTTGQHGALRPGTRIRHRGQQYPDAYRHGTGTVVAITHKPNSGWSEVWGKPDVELIMLRDAALWEGASRLARLAQYHVAEVEQ